VVDFYQKRGYSENYFKEAKDDMAVGHLLLKPFWSNKAIFQLMMLAYNYNQQPSPGGSRALWK